MMSCQNSPSNQQQTRIERENSNNSNKQTRYGSQGLSLHESDSPSASTASHPASNQEQPSLYYEPSNYTAARAVRLPLLPWREIAAEAQISLRQYDYAPLLEEYGYDGIIDAAYMESRAARPGQPFFKSPGAAIATLDYWIDECGPLLADVPLAILESLLDGTLAHKVSVPAVEHQDVAKYFDDSKLTQWVNAQASNGFKPDVSHWVTRMQKSYCPALYVQIFVDRNGQSPTLAQLRNVLDHLEKYMSGKPEDWAVCADIDNQYRDRSTEADISNGLHAYFEGLETRVEELWTFSVALRRVLDDYGPAGSHLDDLPFNGTFKYFGFTANYADRQKAHDRRRSSWLMALFDAVCRTLLRNPNGVPLFSFKHFVIAYPTSRIECQLGEELFCRMGSSYYYTGLGFNIQHAGVSVHSSSLGELLHLEADDMWNACELARYDNPISDLQTQRDFDMFFEKYTQKCEETSDQADAEYAALVEEGTRLQLKLDNLRQELLPYSVFETKYKALQDLWKKVEDGYAPKDSENRDRIRSMSEAALAEFQAKGDKAWGRVPSR